MADAPEVRPKFKPTPPNTKLKPRKFYRNEKCSGACSLSVARLPGDMPNIVHGWFEAGKNNQQIVELAARVNVKISNGAIGRHRKNHLDPVDERAPHDPTDLKLDRVNHIEFLEQLVARGATNVHMARVSPELSLKAIDMIYKLTQGSQMESFMEAVSAAMAGGASDEDDSEYMTAVEAADARMAGEEQAQADVVG